MMLELPNRLTRVPDVPPPELPRGVDLLVPLADLFMVLLLSRPATGSLRRTWVTPATLWLATATGCAALVAVPLALIRLGGLGAVVADTVLVLLSAGALSVAVVGVAQRARI
jgi:hypothetical protein